ncbi:MAG: hypothetical protein ACRELF_11585, partial [Gemmataceae bacterium]
KAALHDVVEEWSLECGLPRTVVEEMRAQRRSLAAQAEATADARAALTLGVEDEDEDHHALPTLSAARVTAIDAGDECPPPGDESALLLWVHRQRERQVGWADIIKAVEGAGHVFNTDALRTRYRRWHEKNNQPNNKSLPSA